MRDETETRRIVLRGVGVNRPLVSYGVLILAFVVASVWIVTRPNITAEIKMSIIGKVVSIARRERRKKMSAAAIARIRAAQRARWAKWRKQQKAV
jgi:hypothetical protein